MPAAEHENLQLLDGEDQRAVTYLIPLLRLADSLDRSHEQRIRSVQCRQRDGDFLITLNVPAETDIDLEIWAAERLSDLFRQVYNKPVAIVRS
jgi:exopolyphosphatase/guanosine-5'-triphosphate,3'-diphosphate pyrophosphatase